MSISVYDMGCAALVASSVIPVGIVLGIGMIILFGGLP